MGLAFFHSLEMTVSVHLRLLERNHVSQLYVCCVKILVLLWSSNVSLLSCTVLPPIKFHINTN